MLAVEYEIELDPVGPVCYLMYVRCAWCDRLIRVTECASTSAGNTSHGICPEDAAEWMSNIHDNKEESDDN